MNAWRLLLVLVVLLCAGRMDVAVDSMSHSRHGSAFDTGLRQRAWKMEGIGMAHFPIATQVAEVQEWFDRGNALL